MLQPFEHFNNTSLQRLLQLKKNYMVTQTYTRELERWSASGKTALLISDYSDEGLAKIHFNAVRHDRYAAIVNLLKPEHYTKLNALLEPGSSFHLYWAVVHETGELQKEVNRRYKDQMRNYIRENTNWRISGDQHIKPSLAVIFGELFITLKYAGQTLRIKFAEIEK